MNRLPQSVQQGVYNLLQQVFGSHILLKDFSFCGGGCINHGGRLGTSEGPFFLKWNDTGRHPGMFAAETNGLKLLAAPGAIRIPAVIGQGEHGAYQFIVLEFVEGRQGRAKDFSQILGRQLAALHRQSHSAYGLDHDNYIGSLPQINKERSSWIGFFIEERLEVQLKTGVDTHAIPRSVVKKFETLYQKLPLLITDEPPALLHGDLWGGNLLTDENGLPCLIDPAVYFGHREMDLAMTKLFGGFDAPFYEAYYEAFPLPAGLAQRLDIYSLYPLLVHVNLFGQSYLHQVNAVLNGLDMAGH